MKKERRSTNLLRRLHGPKGPKGSKGESPSPSQPPIDGPKGPKGLKGLKGKSPSPSQPPTDAPVNTGSTVTSPSPSHSPTDAPSPSPSHSPTDAPSKGEEETEETITSDLFPFFITFDEQGQDGDDLREVLGVFLFDEMSKTFNSLSEILLFAPLSEDRKLQEASLSLTGTASFVSTEGNYVPPLEKVHDVQRTVLEAFDALIMNIHFLDPELTAESDGDIGEEAEEEEDNEAVENVIEDLSDQTGSEEQGDQESDREINMAEGTDSNNRQRTKIVAALTIVAVAAAFCFLFFVSRRRMQRFVKKPVANKEQGSDHSTESKASGSDHAFYDMEVAAVSEESSGAVLAKSDDVAEPEERVEGWANIFRHSSTAHREMLHTVKELVFHDPQKDPEPVASIVPKLEEKQVIVLNRVASEEDLNRVTAEEGLNHMAAEEDSHGVPSIMDDGSYLSAIDSLDETLPSITLQPKSYLDDDSNTGYLKAFALSGQVIDLSEPAGVAGLETENSGGSYDSDTDPHHILRESLQHPIASVLSNGSGFDDSDSDVCYV